MVTASTATDTAMTAVARSLGKDHQANPRKVHQVKAERAPIRRTAAMRMDTLIIPMATELAVAAVAVQSLGKDHLGSLRRVRQAKVARAPIRRHLPRAAKALANRARQGTVGRCTMEIATITTTET